MYIAEIGINHKGSEERAFKMLRELVNTEIDAITFQIVELVQYKEHIIRGYPLADSFYEDAINYIHQNNKLIGFAIRDITKISFLNKAGADFWKVLSKDIKKDDLISQLLKTKKPIFISTGLSSEDEILEVNQKLKNIKNIKFIHTQLSQAVEDTNLKAIKRLNRITGRNIAFGLHCLDHDVLKLAVVFNPSDFFFYIKDNSYEQFADNEHAILIERVSYIVKRLKALQKALGTGIKEKMESKLK